MVHLHNGILRSREIEGAYTLWNGMDRTGEHYAKWNEADGVEEIPHDLTFYWNIMNRRNKQRKYNQRHEVKNNLTIARGEWRGDSKEMVL